MTRAQARLLILLLAHRRIKFTLGRNPNGGWTVNYDPIHVETLRMAYGEVAA